MKCCFCNKEINGMGNSVRPLIRKENVRCCDECNRDIIIPLRMLEYFSSKENKMNDKEN